MSHVCVCVYSNFLSLRLPRQDMTILRIVILAGDLTLPVIIKIDNRSLAF